MHCTFFNIIMFLVSFIGSAYFSILLIATLLLSGNSVLTLTAFKLFTALFIGQVLVHPVKWLINRPRPCIALDRAKAFRALNNNNSFPSGHTCAAVTIALVLSHSLPQLSPVFFSAAFLVGVSRIYLGVHYPSDVLAGGAIGYVSYFFMSAKMMPLIYSAISFTNLQA